MSRRGRARKFSDPLVREVVAMTNMGFARREIAAELNLLYDQVMYIQRKQNALPSAAKPWVLWSEEYKLAACSPWRPTWGTSGCLTIVARSAIAET